MAEAKGSEDPHEKAVLEALSDSRWQFRTVEGVSRSTGLEKQIVEFVIKKRADIIRKAEVPDRRGRALYTLGPPTTAERLEVLRAFVTKST